MDTKLRPALIGGGLLGVLSGIPFVNLGNCLCCGWVIAGGMLAAYLYQKNAVPGPPNYADGALLGAMAGAIGAVVSSIIGIPFSLLGSQLGGMGMSPEQIEQMMGGQELPPAVANMLSTMGSGGFTCAGALIGLFFGLILFSIFGAIGSMIGTAVFTRK